MSTALSVRGDDQEPTPAPLRIGDIQIMAAQVARSRLYGMDEAQAFTLMMLAHSRGLHPVQAVERYHVIQGKPAMKADAMLAEFQAHGGVVTWHQHDAASCSATFAAPSVGEPVRITWGLDDAKRAELLNNPMWRKYPRQMLKARVISEGIRMTMPGIAIGIYTPEEVSDFAPVVASVAEPEARPTLAAPKRGRDDRTVYELVQDGLGATAAEFLRMFPDAPKKAFALTAYQVERHLLKTASGKPTEGMNNTDVRKAIEGLYAHPSHRSAIRRDLKEYLATKLEEARTAYAGEALDAVGQDSAESPDGCDPDSDYPEEPGSNG